MELMVVVEVIKRMKKKKQHCEVLFGYSEVRLGNGCFWRCFRFCCCYQCWDYKKKQWRQKKQ